jgi:hypothetical protein
VAAQRRDPCADRAHQAQVALDLAHAWWVLGQTLDAIGDEAGADDAYAYADYFYAEYEMYANDPAECPARFVGRRRTGAVAGFGGVVTD